MGVGAAFCVAALKGAKLNVLINTRLMKDLELKKQIEDRLYSAVEEGEAIGEKTFRYVEDMLK